MARSLRLRSILICARTCRFLISCLIRNRSQLCIGENSVRSPSVSEGCTRLSGFRLLELPSLTVGLLTRFTYGGNMNPKRFITALLIVSCCLLSASFVRAQDDKKPATKEAPAPRAKDGKKLLTAIDLMKISGVSAPRISPDG